MGLRRRSLSSIPVEVGTCGDIGDGGTKRRRLGRELGETDLSRSSRGRVNLRELSLVWELTRSLRGFGYMWFTFENRNFCEVVFKGLARDALSSFGLLYRVTTKKNRVTAKKPSPVGNKIETCC